MFYVGFFWTTKSLICCWNPRNEKDEIFFSSQLIYCALLLSITTSFKKNQKKKKTNSQVSITKWMILKPTIPAQGHTQIHSFSSTVWCTPAWDYHNPGISPFRPMGHSKEKKCERAKLGGSAEHKGDQSLCASQKNFFKEDLKQQKPQHRGTLQ